MPYIKDDKKYDRITEVVSGFDCEATVYINQKLPVNRPRKQNTSSIQGTLLHNRIAKNELAMQKNPYKVLNLELDGGDTKLLNKLLSDHRIQKSIQQHKRFKDMEPELLKTKYETMNNYINDMFITYASFVADYPHDPIYVEEKRFWDRKMIAGTIDIIMEIPLMGYVQELTLHPEIGKRWYFLEDRNHPNAKLFKTATPLDWKSSRAKQKGHKIQLSAYHFMWEDLGEFDRLRKQGYVINAEAWSILLGKRTRIPKHEQDPKPYQLHRYTCDSTDFLKCLEIRESPRPITVNIEGSVGLKPKCMVCSDIMYCPDNVLLPAFPDSNSFMPLVSFSESDLKIMQLATKKMQSAPGIILKHKIDQISELFERHDRIMKDEALKKISEYANKTGMLPDDEKFLLENVNEK